MADKFIVRHSTMRHLGEFEAGDDVACGRGARVVVHSDRGHEVGDVLCEANPRAVEWITEPTHGRLGAVKVTGSSSVTP